MSTPQHIFAALLLALVYHQTEGRLTVVVLLAFSYFFYVKEFSQKQTIPTITPSTPQKTEETDKEHKHKNGNGGCGKLCTCKDKKNKPKKTLSDLKAKKGFGQKTRTADDEDKAVAVDFTTAFAKAS